MDIYLVRHGEAAASWAQATDPGLSEFGHEQARAAARLLRPRLAARADRPRSNSQRVVVALVLVA